MKTKILILVMAIFFSLKTSAQGMPVYDNTNFISLAKSLIESAKQTSQLLKTAQFLKTQKDNIEKAPNDSQDIRIDTSKMSSGVFFGIVSSKKEIKKISFAIIN